MRESGPWFRDHGQKGKAPGWEFYDAAVSGADHIDPRPGFAAMLERIEGNGARTNHR